MAATKGPWHASGNGVHTRKGTIGLCVAVAYDPDDPNQSNEVCHANARLIAATPDLLAACKALPDFDIDNPDAADFKDHAHEFMNAMRLARAAIAKAEGT